MVPALMCGCAGASTPEESCTVPVSSALSASPPPGNTTVAIRCSPSRSLSTSACSCGAVPIGGAETLNLSGSALASATNSFIVRGRQLGLHGEHVRRGGELADADEILERIVRQGAVQARIDHVGAGREQDGVAVGVGARGQPHADIAAGAALVLHDERAADRLLHGSRHDAGNDVGRPARRVRHHDPDRPVRIGGERGADVQHGRRRDAGRQRAGCLDDAAPGRRPCRVGGFGHWMSPRSCRGTRAHARNLRPSPQSDGLRHLCLGSGR